eukprot:scaffold34922_cov141-Amphora_coffeaeformis.AAC.5
MSRRLALPLFDLVDAIRLKANGGGLFTFYINRLAGNLHTCFSATSDSDIMRALREEDDVGLWDDLLVFAMNSCASSSGSSPRTGLGFRVAIAASEPSTRCLTGQKNHCHHSSPVIWDRLKETLDLRSDPWFFEQW